jgi:ubiquinol-cytochrome c reductase iron-sulfur subunit
MADSAHSPTADQHATGGTRRDFLVIAGNALLGIGAACAVWPLVSSMNPAKDVIAAGAPIDVDISSLKPGQQILVVWRSRPIFVVNRTPAELKKLQEPSDTGLLRDVKSEVNQQPPYAQNWHRSIKPEYLILVGICTHLGCIPTFTPQPGGFLGSSWPGGYFCHCHGSKYDLSGRVFTDVPAPYNLPVPPYHFLNDTTVRIGENPPNVAWEFGSIVQI